MGELRRFRCRPRGRRAVAATGLVVLAVGGAVACQPGDVSSTTVAYTTDRTATAELERQHVSVSWLTCTGDYGEHGKAYTPGRSPSPTATAMVSVDCQGKTDDDRDITVTGRVTRAVDGACVRGDLLAEVAGRRVFHVSGLGDCTAVPRSSPYTPPVTRRPTYGGPGPTVTVTRTVWCPGDPTCRSAVGK
ncbi:hypothetical protein [Streptomyces sp. NPDC005423]|uniref:hypothetical protein n=1 Tax=Streptomyces sp. NPDC005423 TaxID=3155343 RepID=UPI0033BF40A0